MKGKIHIGTSGWSYKHWRGLFYPPGLPVSKWLQHYTGYFSSTEINGSFYRLPTHQTVETWVRDVPDDFIFCPKMSRYLTHMKKLQDPEEPLARFFDIFEGMRGKMGPVLIQLPPQLAFHYDRTEYFYNLLWKQYHPATFVVEIRHPTWLAEESLTLMTKYGIGLVISHSAGTFPYSEMVTANTVYLRLHGPKELYASSYSDSELLEYVKKCRKWVAEGHEVWIYFNNDIHGHAVKDAQRLRSLLAGKGG